MLSKQTLCLSQPLAGVTLAVAEVLLLLQGRLAQKFHRRSECGQHFVQRGIRRWSAEPGIQPAAGVAEATGGTPGVVCIVLALQVAVGEIHFPFNDPARILEQGNHIADDRTRICTCQRRHTTHLQMKASLVCPWAPAQFALLPSKQHTSFACRTNSSPIRVPHEARGTPVLLRTSRSARGRRRRVFRDS